MRAAMQKTLFSAIKAVCSARGPRCHRHSRSEGRKDRPQARSGAGFATDHQTIAGIKACYATTGAYIQLVNAAGV